MIPFGQLLLNCIKRISNFNRLFIFLVNGMWIVNSDSYIFLEKSRFSSYKRKKKVEKGTDESYLMSGFVSQLSGFKYLPFKSACK